MVDIIKDHNINNSLIKIKSNYILKKIFAKLQEVKSLQIIRYNKQIQNKIHKDINDYKNIYHIEIDITPVENKYGNIINYKFSIDNISHYQIYFDDNKKATNRIDIKKDDNVKKIKIILDHNIKSLYGLFRGCKYLKMINFIKMRRKDITDMSYMFYDCSSLESLTFLKVEVKNITKMNFMFCGCCSLKELNLNNFHTNKVIRMNSLFNGCSSLKKLNLSNFETQNVIDMSYMFYECSSLEELILSNFNTDNVYNMSYMFSGCSLLKQINISNFKTNNVIEMNNMFSGCSSLENLNILILIL